jgi:hypothetical protein
MLYYRRNAIVIYIAMAQLNGYRLQLNGYIMVTTEWLYYRRNAIVIQLLLLRNNRRLQVYMYTRMYTYACIYIGVVAEYIY